MKTQKKAREATVRSKVVLSLGLIILVAIILPSAASAEVIKVGFTGVVDNFSDQYNLLENGVNQGDAITGFYIYDSETPNSWYPGTYYSAQYQYTESPFGMSLKINNLTFQTDSTNVDFKIGITNGIEEFGINDCYSASSSQNLSLENGTYIERLDWQLDDWSNTAISSIDLPAIHPDLSVWKYGGLYVSGGIGTAPCFEKPFYFNGHITSFYLIPEPCSIVLLSLGGLFLRRKS